MTLDDLFAKKAKKKTKKKHNPQDLLEQLTKEVSKKQETESEARNDVVKTTVNLGRDDEWEAIDDEENDIDLQALQFGNLSIASVSDAKQPTKDKSAADAPAEPEEEKKVWSVKVPETPVVEEPVVEEQPVQKPSVYIPVHLRAGGLNVNKGPKPDVESTMDFPTLDLAAVPEPAPTKAEPKSETEEDASWEQAGVPRKHQRGSEMLPIAISQPQASSYVPPSLRTGASRSMGFRTDNSESRTREDFTPRYESRRPEAPSSHDSHSNSFGGAWSRGETIVREPGVSAGFSRSQQFPASSRPVNTNSGSSGWERGVVMKTFRETGQEKAQFQLTQSNRFAGLSES